MADDHQEAKARENIRNAIRDHPNLHTLVGLWALDGPIIADVVKDLDRKKDFSVVIFDADQQAVAQMGDGLIDDGGAGPLPDGAISRWPDEGPGRERPGRRQEGPADFREKEGDVCDIGLKVVVPDQVRP